MITVLARIRKWTWLGSVQMRKEGNKMPDREKVIEILEKAKTIIENWVPMFGQYNTPAGIDDAIALLKEQEARIKKYEHLFDFLGIGFREWATKIIDGEAEAICEADEHEHKTVITFKLI